MKRFRLLFFLIGQFLVISALLRLGFYLASLSEISFSVGSLLRILVTGSFYDFGTVSFFALPYVLFLLLTPSDWVGRKADRIISYIFYGLTTLIFSFSFFAEVTFWDEFESRFNFISVDYLVYTWEVVENIHQSYPLHILIPVMLAMVVLQFWSGKKLKSFHFSFSTIPSIHQKASMAMVMLATPLLFAFFIKNSFAEWSANRYENELSKAGIYSFFAAFRSNQLDYDEFYLTQDINRDFSVVRQHLYQENEVMNEVTPFDLSRKIIGQGEEQYPNVIFICVESLSAGYLSRFGNEENLTPNLDRLANESISFDNIFATGTRTVRGMEAITLSVPPSPGRSIVKRPENSNLFNIGDVFAEKGYKRVFFYGGDGYFDNMNQFFGSNGFDIVDRGRGYLLGDDFNAKRTNIDDEEVTFENAWGVCDQDIYSKVLKEADKSYAAGERFFNFVMTTSNHRPFTYPDGTVDIPSGEGRNGTVKYTDFAIGEFLEKARQKPWFKNTVFAIMADHCAKSAGKWELNVAQYHIPAILYNLPEQHDPRSISSLCSQIDFFPTLFGYLNWSYTSHFYGRDVNRIAKGDERALIGNYRKLGLLKDDTLWVLADQKQGHAYTWNIKTNELQPVSTTSTSFEEIIAYYQSMDYLYQHGLLKHLN